MSNFVFDPTVNLGQLATALMIILGGVAAISRTLRDISLVKTGLGDVKEDLKNFDRRMDGVDAELAKQTEILIKLGAQDARLNSLESQMLTLHQQLLGASLQRAVST
jgi:hypothetical protein